MSKYIDFTRFCDPHDLLSRKNIAECSMEDFDALETINAWLPKGAEIVITDTEALNEHDDPYIPLIGFIYDEYKKRFDVSREDYEEIVGKIFMNKERGEMIKVLALPDKDDKKFKYNNFIYECYVQNVKSKDWFVDNDSWLQYYSHSVKELKKYADMSPYANINYDEEYNTEFMLDTKGVLFFYDCANRFNRYEEVDESVFEKIKTEAIENEDSNE